MSQTFHSKYHRANHMTLKNPNLPDAGWDPIASDTVPFSGDFYMAPTSAMHVDNITNSQQGNKVSLNSNFVVTGDTTLNKTLTVGKKTILNDELDVKGYSHFFDNVLIDKNATVEKNFYVSGEEAKIKNYLGVLGYEYITGKDDDDYGLKVDNKIYAGGIDLTGDLIINGNCYVTQEITASTGKFKEASAMSATADVLSATSATVDVLYVKTLLSAVSATFHNIDITASEGRGFVVTGYAPDETVPVDYFEVPTTPFTHGDKNVYLDKVGLFVDGWTVLSGDTLLHRKLNVSGETALKNTSIGGTLGVTGATTLSILNATGAVDFDSTLNVDGATTLNGGVTVKTSPGNKSMTFDGEKIFRKDGTQAAGTFLFPSYGGTLVARPNSPLPPSGNIPMFDEYGNIVDSGNDATDFYPMVEKTWEQLKAMRDGGTLVPGQRYRITDYVATTVQVDTQSANHPFDIIVRADSTNKLNENAYAIKNAEDTTYFVNSKLEAWQVWYCLDNDTNRFAWADSANGKGVVYRLIDEFNNDCPYDFKGITMKAYGDTDNVYRYTFDSGAASNNTDYSLIGGTRNVYNNVIGKCLVSNKLRLNQIIFKGNNCYSNTFWTGCYSNTFGDGCCSNMFKHGCHSNTFGDSFHTNTFGDGCYSNTFGDDCHSNTFGGYYSSNTFGDGCHSNTFGDYCSSNTFGDGCHSNTFGDYCSSNTFGNNCDYNAFGGHCATNTFGNNCDYNTFRRYSDYNTFGNRCSSNTFGTGCDHILFKNDTATKNYVSNIIVEDGNRYITLNMTGTSTSADPYRNVTLAAGLNNTTTNKTITDSTNGGQTFKTVFQPAGSQVISV